MKRRGFGGDRRENDCGHAGQSSNCTPYFVFDSARCESDDPLVVIDALVVVALKVVVKIL